MTDNQMTDKVKKAFDFGQDTTKQLLTLATGIMTVTIAFSNVFTATPITSSAKTCLMFSWISFLLSICFCIWTLMALTGSLQSPKEQPKGIYEMNKKIPSVLQIITFLLGLILTITFGLKRF
jgi:hypothetical protein